MARYGVSEYGASFYGAPALALFSASPITGTVTGYGSVHLTWRSPGGTWDELRLIRNYHGYPVAVDNGVEVYTALVGGDAAEFRESGLLSDRWVYYTIFVHDNTQDEWVVSGSTRLYVPADYASAQRLFDLTPAIAQSEPLLRFMEIFGFAHDVLRNDANSLLDLNDGNALLYDFVPAAMQQFGIPPETELEPERYRRFLRSAMRFYKTKGTRLCAHGVVSAVTGWDSAISVGNNMLHDAASSDFTGGFGLWDRGAVNCTVSWVAPVGNTPAAMRLTAVATGDLHTTFAPAADVPLLGLTVKAGRQYSAVMQVRAADIAQAPAHIDLKWYDLAGVLLSTSSGTPVPTRQGVDSAVKVTATAPVNAVWAVPVVAVDGAAVGSHWDIRRMQVNESPTPLPYQPGRDIRIALFADRVNEIPNSSFEAGVAGWTAFGNASLAVDNTRAFTGTRSARVTYTGTGVTGTTPPTDGVYCTFATVPGRRYGVQLEVAGDATADPSALVVQAAVTNVARTAVLLDSDGSAATFSSPTIAGAQNFGGGHFAPAFAFVADSTEVTLLVGFNTAETNHAFSLDAIIAERADVGTGATWRGRDPVVVRPYFDGATMSLTADYFWEGAPYNSRSHFYSRMSIHRARLEAVLPRYLPFGATFTLIFAPPPQPIYVTDDTILVTTDTPPTASVGRSLSVAWGQRFNDAAILALRWKDISAAAASLSMQWKYATKVGASDALRWNILSGISVVQRAPRVANTPTFPAATTAGNSILLVVITSGAAAQPAIAGFTKVYDPGMDANTNMRIVYYLRSGGASVTSITTTFSAGTNSPVGVFAYEITGSVALVASNQTAASSPNNVSTTLSGSGNALVFCAAGGGAGGTATSIATPAGYTKDDEYLAPTSPMAMFHSNAPVSLPTTVALTTTVGWIYETACAFA